MAEKQFIAMILYSVTFLLLFFSTAHGDECEPEFADTCFSSVEEDIRFMLHLKKSEEINITDSSVREMCLSLEDALNCTSDIIDSDCKEADGRLKFDSWLLALRAAYSYVCAGKHNRLKSLFEGISCWSIEDFYLCSMDKANIHHISDLLHTTIDKAECKKLNSVVSVCYQESKTGSCREREDMSVLVSDMIQAFFNASHCNEEEFEPHTSSAVLTVVSSALVFLAMVTTILLWSVSLSS